MLHACGALLSVAVTYNVYYVCLLIAENGMSSQLKTASLGSKVHLTPKKKAANSTFSKSPTGAVSPRDRIISSKVHAIKSLQNELADAKRELVELRKENKLLNRIQIRQEKDLAKYVSSLWYGTPATGPPHCSLFMHACHVQASH